MVIVTTVLRTTAIAMADGIMGTDISMAVSVAVMVEEQGVLIEIKLV